MAILGIIGALIAFIGWIWLVVVAFKAGGALWGILNIFLQPVTGLIFCVVKKAGWTPFIVMIVGVVLAVGFGGIDAFNNYPGVNP